MSVLQIDSFGTGPQEDGDIESFLLRCGAVNGDVASSLREIYGARALELMQSIYTQQLTNSGIRNDIEVEKLVNYLVSIAWDLHDGRRELESSVEGRLLEIYQKSKTEYRGNAQAGLEYRRSEMEKMLRENSKLLDEARSAVRHNQRQHLFESLRDRLREAVTTRQKYQEFGPQEEVNVDKSDGSTTGGNPDRAGSLFRDEFEVSKRRPIDGNASDVAVTPPNEDSD